MTMTDAQQRDAISLHARLRDIAQEQGLLRRGDETALEVLNALAERAHSGTKTTEVCAEVEMERAHQDAKWGQQNYPDGTAPSWGKSRDGARRVTALGAELGQSRWLYILQEEVLGAFAETDPARLRAELVQVAAVAVSWIECIDRRGAK